MTRIVPISIPEVKLPPNHYTYFDKWKNQYFFVTPRGDRSKIYHEYDEFVKALKLYLRKFLHERQHIKHDEKMNILYNRFVLHDDDDRRLLHEQNEKDVIPSSWSFIRKNPKKKKTVKKKAAKKIVKKKSKKKNKYA